MHPRIHRDIFQQLLFLGTGTSYGVPLMGCGCATCTHTNVKNQRTRCSIALGLPEGVLLVDTPPDMRTQFLREKLGQVHAVIYTHEHADHLFGLDDLRIFADYLGHDLPVYCDTRVERRIRSAFDYAFDAGRKEQSVSYPRLVLNTIDERPLDILGARITPIPLMHGRMPIFGYRVGKVAYCTDVSHVPPSSFPLLENLDVLVLDCVRHKPHPTHLCLEQSVQMAKQIGAKRTLFTHMGHDLEHEATMAILPPGVELAYDGLVVPLV
jgi:phosphoribosyl 1,2-cyclic phosphate phosphodiesterase